MSFLVSDCYPGIQDNLMGRTVDQPRMAEAIRKTAIEFSENYKFPELQTSGPVVQLTIGVPNYDPLSFFGNSFDIAGAVGDNGADIINKFNSIFLYSGPYYAPGDPAFTGTNSGYNLVFKTIDRLEVLLNIESMPTNWSRFDNQIWIAARPDKAYYCYARYQHAQAFPNRGTANAGTDRILFPNTWQEIVEYGAAQRLAQIYNLSTKVSELNQRLLGDSKFQLSDGVEGQPGLIFQRTSQEMRDQTTTTKRFRLRMTSQR
jgi:hypothetical protein